MVTGDPTRFWARGPANLKYFQFFPKQLVCKGPIYFFRRVSGFLGLESVAGRGLPLPPVTFRCLFGGRFSVKHFRGTRF